MNCFKYYQKYIHILNCILDLAWPKSIELTLDQLSYTVYTISADALATLGATALAGMVLT